MMTWLEMDGLVWLIKGETTDIIYGIQAEMQFFSYNLWVALFCSE
jgi:hypothetical protein